MIEQLPLELACVEFLLDKNTDIMVNAKEIDQAPPVKKSIDNNQTVNNLSANWSQVVEQTKPLNHSISTLLITSHPLDATNNIITIGVEYDFHKEQLDKSKVKNHLSGILTKILDNKVSVAFIVDENFKDNHQIFKGKNESGVGDALDTFGGELM